MDASSAKGMTGEPKAAVNPLLHQWPHLSLPGGQCKPVAWGQPRQPLFDPRDWTSPTKRALFAAYTKYNADLAAKLAAKKGMSRYQVTADSSLQVTPAARANATQTCHQQALRGSCLGIIATDEGLFSKESTLNYLKSRKFKHRGKNAHNQHAGNRVTKSSEPKPKKPCPALRDDAKSKNEGTDLKFTTLALRLKNHD
ncbi:hypothetical protein N7461_006925 [Penicillium sp. DV-2018c]|nr:hypothetical protein N7461_006925 [Penicillium sp. DV-2018c]